MSNLIKMFEIYICLSRTNLMQIYSSKIKIRSLAPWKMKLIIFNSLYSENKNSEKNFFFWNFFKRISIQILKIRFYRALTNEFRSYLKKSKLYFMKINYIWFYLIFINLKKLRGLHHLSTAVKIEQLNSSKKWFSFYVFVVKAGI